jgi:histidyl-tRNA synthetase
MANETVKGFKDVSGKDALKRERIKEIIVGAFKNYGFEPAETPVIEYEEFAKSAELGREAISDIFRLTDKGKRKLALRYEFTFQLKRLARNKKLPYKRYQIGEVFRDEPVSANRLRQFVQCDADIVGVSIKDEAEIIALACEILQKLVIRAIIIINNKNLLIEILEKEGIRDKEAVIREIDKLDKLPLNDVRENLKRYKAEKLLDLFKKPEAYFKKYGAYKKIEELKKYCSYYNVKVKFQPSLARGLSYYNGTIFEIKTADMKESLGGGGSYPVNGIPATGISFGLDRIAEVAKVNAEEKRVLVINIAQDRQAIKLAGKLREEDIAVVVMDKITNALEYANSMGVRYVIFIGEREVAGKKFKLRDMRTGAEKMLSEAELIKGLQASQY